MSCFNPAASCLLFLVLYVGSPVHSKTNSPDVSALNVMFTSLNSPSQLSGWKSKGGDPCGESWKGITCSRQSVTEISISGLGLTGSLGYQLSSLTSVTNFDVSENNLKGDIPYQLPPNVNRLDLSKNGFTGGVPYSISQMRHLSYLNIANNQLSGQLSDMFGSLSKLQEMDLSSNSITGNLPQSFGKLKSLKSLYLQNNQFTGQINDLGKLTSLEDLNLENNQFSGQVPNNIKNIKNLQIGGTNLSGASSHGSGGGGGGSSKKMAASAMMIVVIALGVLVFLALVIVLFVKKKPTTAASHYLDEIPSEHRSFTPLATVDSSMDLYADGKDGKGSTRTSAASIDIKGLQSSASIRLKPSPSSRIKSFGRNEFDSRISVKKSVSIDVKWFSLADLQPATNNFAAGRLLGDGTIGRTYKAKFGDGKVLAVKKISSSLFQGKGPKDINELVKNISRLNHANVATLVGYCSEEGHNMLVYEYFRNGSLHEFLHLSDDFSKPLTWNTRVKIALGIAKAVEYLHEVCTPSTVHKNIKSPNVLLDAELHPRLTDCGLAVFHDRTSQNLGTGYNAPECTKPSAFSAKSDVYSYGVVMLELLTGRMPFDSNKPRPEQCLVRWATPQLHDIDALEKMVDPALRGLYPPKSISRFADIVSQCVQATPEFRPAMSEVVQSLVRLVNKRGDELLGSRRADSFDY